MIKIQQTALAKSRAMVSTKIAESQNNPRPPEKAPPPYEVGGCTYQSESEGELARLHRL